MPKPLGCSKLFSFAEVVKGCDASVRVTDDSLFYAVDLAMVISGKDRNNAGRDLRDLPDAVFQSTKFVDRQISNHGGHKTKLVSFENALELIMVLPGKVAKETRKAFASIIHRYLAGDKSLITDIEANAGSSSPIAQLARASLPEPNDHENRIKRIKREDLELDMAERRLRLEEGVHRLEESRRGKALEHTSTAIELIKSFTVLDERTSLQFEDHIKNVILSSGRSFFHPNQQQALLANNNNGSNGQPGPVSINETESLSVSVLVGEMGHRCTDKDIQSIGRVMAGKYREKYGKEPTKHKQFVKGNYVPVNSYMVRDRAMMEQAVREVVGGGGGGAS
jgi:hypothetical protein